MKAIVMAGGKGTRISDPTHPIPKVLREANGKPLLEYVLNTISMVDKSDVTIIVGYMREQVIKRFPGYRYAVQEQQLGTGHAVMCAIEASDLEHYDGDVLVLCGDTPLISAQTVRKLEEFHKTQGNACTILSCVSEEDDSLGRIVRENGKVCGIVEAADCTPEQKKITEKNSGLCLFDCKSLCSTIKKITNDNKKGEYYLTDVPKLLIAEDKKIDAYITPDKRELLGVNTAENLAQVEALLRQEEV